MRKPDVVIGDGYLSRWFIIPRNRFFNIYLHRFTGSDDDRALHDHPWWSVSFLLKGGLKEAFTNKYGCGTDRAIYRFFPVVRSARFAHRLILTRGPAWTLFITGPRVREWGFRCPKGWVHWRDFTDTDGTGVGKGCG